MMLKITLVPNGLFHITYGNTPIQAMSLGFDSNTLEEMGRLMKSVKNLRGGQDVTHITYGNAGNVVTFLKQGTLGLVPVLVLGFDEELLTSLIKIKTTIATKMAGLVE